MKFEIRNEGTGEVVVTGHDRKSVMEDAAGLAPGNYTLWKLAGSFTIDEVPATKKVAYASATQRKKAATEQPELPFGGNGTAEAAEGRGGLLSRLRG